MLDRKLHFEQGLTVPQGGIVNDRFEKLPIFFVLSHPVPAKFEALFVGSKAMMLEFFI